MPSPDRRSWFEKNWWWSIPSCCLGCLGLTVGGCVLLVGGAWTALRTSTPYQEGLDRAREHPAVIERLGEPIEAGWQLSGSFDVDEGESTAGFSIPLHGPKGDAELRSKAHKENGEWVFDLLEVEFDDGSVVDLLGAIPVASSPQDQVPWRGFASLRGLQGRLRQPHGQRAIEVVPRDAAPPRVVDDPRKARF